MDVSWPACVCLWGKGSLGFVCWGGCGMGPAVLSPPATAGHTCRHLLRNPDAGWDSVPDLPRAATQLLDSQFTRSTSRLVGAQDSAGGDAVKLLVRLQDGAEVEAVIMLYDTRAQDELDPAPRGGERATLCVSSEVGCAMGCTFCATGTMGLLADLTAGEIVEQLVHALHIRPIRNIVFMV